MEYYFETDDKLERKKYAEFLKSMLENCDKYRREDSDGAYVIAIDSPWGTGKTRFAKMLRNFLEDRTKEMGADSRPGKNASFNAIYYNSWETDFSDDALLPLIHSITKSSEFKAERFTKKSQKFLEEFKGAATAVAKVAAYSVLHNLAGETVTEMVKAADDAVSRYAEDPLKSYQERLKLLDDFRKSLEKVVEQTKQKKLVIIVDELDRCRPTFAIQTLELAKHLFAIPNLVFVFFLDVKQLSYAVDTIYGKGMDPNGYLCRFFDYIGKLPVPQSDVLINACIERHEKLATFQLSCNQKLSQYFVALSKSFSLSLRDITTIIETYKVMFDSFLREYKDYQFHYLYIFLLTLKYKRTSEYSDFLINTRGESSNLASIKNSLPQISKKESTILNDQVRRVANPNLLKSIEFGIYNCDVERRDQISGSTGFYIGAIRPGFDNNGKKLLLISTRIKSASNDTTFPGTDILLSEREVLNDVLDFNDLLKWGDIQGISLGQYYYQQLEMFNFALPADEPESKS